MFGVFYLLGRFIASTIGSVKEQIYDYQCKQGTKDGFSYIDSGGIMRLVSNDHPLLVKHNEKTDKHDYIDFQTGQVIKSEFPTKYYEALKERRQKAIAEGKTVIVMNDIIKMEMPYRQYALRDVYTHDEYVVRKIRDRYYYVNTTTGLVVREADSSKKKIIKGDGIHEDELNKRVDINKSTTSSFPAVLFTKECTWKL